MEYLKPFLTGGAVIAGAKGVSKILNPVYGAIVGGMPTGIISTFFLEKDKVKEFYHGYAYHALILSIVIILIHYILDNYDINPNIVSVMGMIVWAILSFLISKYYLLKK